MPFYLMALYGSIMIVMVLILRTLLKNRLPKFVFPVLWSLVLLRFLIPFSISIPLSMPVPDNPFGVQGPKSVTYAMVVEDTVNSEVNVLQGTAQISEDAVSTMDETDETTIVYGNSPRPVFTFTPYTLQYTMLVVYIIGMLAAAGVLGWQKYGYSKKLQNGFLVEHNDMVNAILRDMGMGHVLVFTSDEIATPLVCGLLNPRIYLPTQMDFTNTVMLRHVLIHEAMHIRRKDNWVKGLLLIVLCLNWYNPLVWLMAVCLAADLEAACDAAVLKTFGEDERKDYASSLFAMALTGRRTTLLYSAFSKTEVEKRIRNILRYKKATAFVLVFTVLFLTGSMVAFAAVGQAPFQEEFTSFCASDRSRWGVKVSLARDIALGERAQEKAESVIFSILIMDDTDDPRVIEDRIRAALAEEFGVEKGAFHIMIQLCLSEEELEEEYAEWGITRAKDGFWMYQEEQIRIYEDKMLGAFLAREKGTVDISVQRDALGEVVSVTVWRQGDPEFDERTGKTKLYRPSSYGAETTQRFENMITPSESSTTDLYDGTTVFYNDYYEYYLTKEELMSDIEQGYIFKVDTEFTKKADTEYIAPYVSQENWPFYVHEDNTVNLEIAFSNLLTKPNKNIFPESERIIVDVISPDGQSVYHFEKVGEEITEDTSLQEQISVTPGEWKLQISFAYVCGKTPAHLRISAAYETPSEEDINWLKEERLK